MSTTETAPMTQEQPERLSMWEQAYMDVQKILDGALGTEEEDGAGAGIAADVAMVVAQRDRARAEAKRLAGRLKELTEPGLFAAVPAAPEPQAGATP
jgi:hypothetical protein